MFSRLALKMRIFLRNSGQLVCLTLTKPLSVFRVTATRGRRDKGTSKSKTHSKENDASILAEPSEQISTDPMLTVHALLIGIDHYISDQFPDLRGAVSDMRRVKDFLLVDLGVERELVRELTNENATRQAIVEAIEDLASPTNKVRAGDPILIYFAGHGSTVDAPQGWTADPKIQVLVPHDARSSGKHAENVIHDRKFGSLLRDLADKKGDNITVILDCCHSTSGTRSTAARDDDGDYVTRGVEFKQAGKPDAHAVLSSVYASKDEIDDEVEGHRGLSTNSKFLNAGLRSHVLLAACGETQSALEKKGSGVFTTALLSLFKTKGIDTYTYAEIITSLGSLAKGRQTPQCEGAFKLTRKLFNSRIHFRGTAPLSVRLDDDKSGYTLPNAGEVHGIAPGTVLAIYSSVEDAVAPIPLCFASVINVYATISTLRLHDPPLDPLPPTAVALLFQSAQPLGKLRICIPENDQLRFVYDAIERAKRNAGVLWDIKPSVESEATLGAMLEGNSIAFSILDQNARELGMTKLRVTVPLMVQHVTDVLRAAAHYFFHVYRMPPTPQIRDKVSMHVYMLEETDDLDEDLRRVLRPAQPQVDLISQGELSKSRAGIYTPWNVEADDAETYYGVEVHNGTNAGLFLSMFYFDGGTFEIRQLYSSSTAAPNAPNLEPPLRPRGTLSLNYGSGGGEPLRFVVDEDEDMDLGVLRIFISDKPFDLDIEQNALETIQVSEGTRKFAGATGADEKRPEKMGYWDVLTLPIIQTKPRSTNQE